jgi:predicted Zn-dependent protease with MMP-like domain
MGARRDREARARPHKHRGGPGTSHAAGPFAAGTCRGCCSYAGVVHLPDAEFDDLVADALDRVPEQLARLMDNVVVLVEDEPPPEEAGVLGLYVGTPLTSRDTGYTFQPPDQVFVYRGPLLRMCHDAEELADEVTVTVVHEIAHHFGIDDDQLHEWGWS